MGAYASLLLPMGSGPQTMAAIAQKLIGCHQCAGRDQRRFAALDDGSVWSMAAAARRRGEIHDTSTVDVASRGFTGWMTGSMTFTATSASELLELVSLAPRLVSLRLRSSTASR